MTVANTGNATMTVTGMTVTAGLGSVVAASWTNGAIGAGLTQQVSIQFTPASSQTYSGVLTVNGDQTAGANTIAMSGTGTGQSSPTPLPSCSYTLSLGSTIDGYPGGGSFPATVTTTAGCAWAAVSNVSWIHIQTPTSGNGVGVFTFTVDANTTTARTGTVTVAGKTITFNQTASTPTPTPTPAPTRTRVGAICVDGTSSSATGSGACSSHGGVRCWLYSDGTCTNP
jgi:hypothetical protein